MKLVNDSAVILKKVTKYYQNTDKIVVFYNANLTVKKGEFLGVFAPSGMGKTTLVLLIAGIIKPNKGKIFVLGHEITHMNRKELAFFRRKNIGIVFQFFNLINTLTVVENVMLPMELNGINKKEAYERALKLLEYVGLKEKAHVFPAKLSGGEQQRVALARALAHNPKIILADEPTGNLDEDNKRIVFELLRDVNRQNECTIIIATHDIELASKYVSRAVKIQNKKFVEWC